MNKNIKKGKVAASSLIALGNNNKARNALPLQTLQTKKIKTDDLNPKVLLNTIDQTIKQDCSSSETALINFLSAMKLVLITSNKPIKTYLSQFLVLYAICKKYPFLFTKSAVVDCMVSTLSYNGKESSNVPGLTSSFKPQNSMTGTQSSVGKIKPLHITICNLLMFSFRDNSKWPVQFIKAYLEDSFADRIWVDLPECFLFVQNIETAFPTPGIDPRIMFPPLAFSESIGEFLSASEGSAAAASTASSTSTTPTTSEIQDHSDLKAVHVFNKMITELTSDDFLRSRFDHCKPAIVAMLAGYIKDIIDRRFMADTQSRPIIRAFSSLAGLPEVRAAAVIKSDNWLSTNKLQASTLNMLTIMASSCTQNITQNSNDINFCVYLMFRFKYKLSKPPVQTVLLECIRKIAESHQTNLRSLLEIYINNEIYGSPTVISGTSINSTNPGSLVPVPYSSQNKSGPVSVTFPALFFRFPSESIRILGDLLHEQMCLLYSDIRPVKLFIRDMCRWVKLAHLNSNGVYTSLAVNGILPDSLELHELAQTWLADRSNHEALISRMNDSKFKESYVKNIIDIVCEIQMLSVIRPVIRDIFKERADPEKKDLEALKCHYNTVRQIRYFTCKWLKNIFPMIESHEMTVKRMTKFIKQALFINVSRNNDFSYDVDESYAMGDIWNTESDRTFLIRGLTEVPLSEKLIQSLINIGFENTSCFRPSEIVDIISELIIRASATASNEIIPMNLSKGELIITNMFAACSCDEVSEENSAMFQIARTLGYKSSFWNVCQALVLVACFCPSSCGAFLWNHFPTVRNLMQIIITNNFDELRNDKEAMESERQFLETDSKKIFELETLLIETAGEECPVIDANNSKLLNLLLLNLPQGPVRQPPADIVESLKSINQVLKIGDRLSQCRNPDFLFEIVREQDQNKISSRKWIIDLVRKTSEHNLDCLPLLCLTEFIYHYMYEKIIHHGNNSQQQQILTGNDSKDSCLKQVVHKIRQILSVPEIDTRKAAGTGISSGTIGSVDKDNLKNVAAAFSNSFFNRLSDSSAFIRKVARECLYILLQPVSSAIKLMDSSSYFVDTLKSIMSLNIFQVNTLICSVAEALRETLKFETDIDVLHSYIDLFVLMSSGTRKEWLGNTVETLSILILNRPIIADKLRSRDYETLSKSSKHSPTLICDSLAEIFLAHINYVAFQAQVVPLEHRQDAVMVTVKDKQFPVIVKVIQSQLALVCWGVSKSKKCKKLIDFWFTKSGTKYHLPTFTNIDSNTPATEIIPDWLVNAAAHCGTASVMLGIMHYNYQLNKRIAHSLTPALYFMPNDFIKAYLNFLNSIIKSDPDIVESWLSSIETSKMSSMLATVTKMYTKVKGVDGLFKSILERHVSIPADHNEQKMNLQPKQIVRPLEKSRIYDQIYHHHEEQNSEPMEIDNNNAGVPVEKPEETVWNCVIQSYGSTVDQTAKQPNLNVVHSISEAINTSLLLLSSSSNESELRIRMVETLFTLMKDVKTHSETLRVLNKADFKLMPLLKLVFRSSDQASFDFAMKSFRFLFKKYPHIEKSTLWRVVYNLSRSQGVTLVTSNTINNNVADVSDSMEDDTVNATPPAMMTVKYPTIVKSLAKSIMQGNVEDAAKIGPKIDQLTILGIGNGQFSDSHFEMVHKLLFSSHALNQYSDYFMSDLLHQSNMFCLRQILHSILNRKTISQINASRVLDFITACLHHPRVQYSVVIPTANRHIWPQQNVEIELTENELITLLNLVISEVEHLIEQNGPNARCVQKCLNKRSHLVDTCSSCPGLLKERYGIINRFIDSKSHNPTVEKFGFAFYSRLPNLINNNSSSSYQSVIGGKECWWSLDKSMVDVDCYNIKEIHKIGQRLLAGLVSPRNDLQDLAIQACKALVTRHPKLCVQLLPYICALSDGALDNTDAWIDFRKKRGQILYSNLLHLLEIMIPFSLSSESVVRSNINRILFNFLRVLIRYRDQKMFFVGFVTRFVNFLEKMIPMETTNTIHNADYDENDGEENNFIMEHHTEIAALSKVYPQFRNLIVYVQKSKEACSNLLSSLSTGEAEENRSSQLPLLKLDLLVNFRRKIREIQTGNGILVQIKDLDDVSKRDTNIIGLFVDDLRTLINHSMNDVRISAVQILARYLNTFPEQAARIIGDFIVPNMMKSSWFWSRPFTNLTLKALCQTGMLAPYVVPQCLSNHARLIISGNNGRGNFRETVELLEVIIENISLESFMESPATFVNKSAVKKDIISSGSQKRQFLDDNENHKAKRCRFK